MSHTNPLYLANAIELLLAASGSKLGAINAGDIPVLYIEANGTRYVMGIRDRLLNPTIFTMLLENAADLYAEFTQGILTNIKLCWRVITADFFTE